MRESYQAESVQEQFVSNDEKVITETPLAPAQSRIGVILALLAVYFIWGSTYLGMRVALEGFPPFLLAGIRFLLAGGMLYLFLRVRGAPTPSRAQWAGAALIGVLLLTIGNGAVVFAVQWVATGLTAVGIGAVPLWAALFAGLWGRWPTRIEWLGLGLGFVGVMFLNLGGGLWASPLGAVALLIGAISWALGSVWSRHVSLPSGLMSSATQMLIGGGVLLLLSLSIREPMPSLHTARPLLAMAFLIFFGSLIGFCAYGYLLRRVRPALATSYAYVNPLVAVALGIALNGEHITIVGLLAMLAIIAGVGLVSLGGDFSRVLRGGRP